MRVTVSQTSRPRRTRAVFAGMAVIGLGAMGTLALWADSEFVLAPFGAVGFQVESAITESGPYESHDSGESAALLQFDFPAGELVEGEPVTAEFWLRMASGSVGSVSVLAPTVENDDLNGLIDVTVAQGSCNSAGRVLQQGLLEELVAASGAFQLPAGVAGNPGPAQGICFTATLNDISELPVGEHSTGRVGWEFRVTEGVA